MNRPNFIFEICRSKTAIQKWYWHCRAANGEIRCHSENYAHKAGAINAVKSFCRYMKKGSWLINESWRERTPNGKLKGTPIRRT